MRFSDYIKIYISGHIERLEGHIDSQYIGCTFTKENPSERMNQWTKMQTDMEHAEYADYEEVKNTVKTTGRKQSHLFMDSKGCKDVEMTDTMCEQFKRKLYEHLAEEDAMLEAKNDNLPSALFIDFYLKWMKTNMVEKYVNGHACYRFLKEDCGIACNTTEKNYSDWLKLKISLRM